MGGFWDILRNYILNESESVEMVDSKRQAGANLDPVISEVASMLSEWEV